MPNLSMARSHCRWGREDKKETTVTRRPHMSWPRHCIRIVNMTHGQFNTRIGFHVILLASLGCQKCILRLPGPRWECGTSLRTAEGACHCTVSMPYMRFSQVPMIWTSCGTVSKFRVPKIHLKSTRTWMRTRDKSKDRWWNLPFYFVRIKYVNLFCWLYSLCNVIEYYYCIYNFYFSPSV
jgi:hypothetical protein